MSSLLIPVSVVAKIVKTKTPVASLGGQPFNQDAQLEPGIHVHWALPDALTRAQSPGSGTTNEAIVFPGVPDLWLVTRFNPPPAANAPSATRTWRAWVVESRIPKATPLESWTAAAAPDVNSIHTVAGVLPSAKDIGFPGWGLFKDIKADFDAVITSSIYYPSTHNRFGFYDDLSGLPGSGSVSYTVVGWYNGLSNDPLYNTAKREKQISDWLLRYEHHKPSSQIYAPISATLAVSAWKPQVTVTQQTQKPIIDTHATVSSHLTAERTASMQLIQGSFGKVDVNIDPGLVINNDNPVEIVCHGSVVDIPLGTTPPAPAKIDISQVSVYPSIKRALAATTAGSIDPKTLDYAEMLIQDLDHQKGTMAGILDLPGAAHALSFQDVPGKSTYYAQIRISTPPISYTNQFQVTTLNEGVVSSGHWPVRGGTVQTTQPLENNPGIPPWLKKVRQDFSDAQAAAQSAGTPIHPSLVKVSDTRAHAQPFRLAPSIDGSSTSGGGWWIDMSAGDDALTQIFLSTSGTDAIVETPTASNLYNEPGPRWYRPWCPQIVLNNVGRSYRFGEDGRFDPKNGTLLCRTSGHTISAVYSNGGTPVSGTQLMANPGAISAAASLPSIVLPLLYEALLLDTGSTPSMAAVSASGNARAAAESYFKAAIQGIYLYRLPSLSAQQLEALDQIQIKGDQPSPVAITPWLSDPWDPLFLDSSYTYGYSSLANDWKLEEDQVEMTAANAAATNPPAAQTETFNDRSRVTATISKVLSSALITRQSLDPRGVLVRRQAPPNNLSADVFQTQEVLSAPLVHTQLQNQPGSAYGAFDDALIARGYRSRAGVLTLSKLGVIDVFGISRQWTASPAAAAPSTTLTPRLPFWSRLSFRLQSADAGNIEADSQHTSICGILLPDFVDHSLEVFDKDGKGLGQISCDRARFGGGAGAAAATLQVRFTPYPWVAAARGITTTDPAAVITQTIDNLTLRQLVAGIAQQSFPIPANASPSQWYESGLTAMMRTVDAVRATLSGSQNTPDHKVSLLGEPILVMVGRVALQTNSATSVSAVAGTPPLGTPPAMPSISVRIGDVTRPDDGVLGIFKPGNGPADSHFAPVSKDAADKALLNGVSQGLFFNSQAGMPVQHPFVLNQINVINVQPDVSQDVVLLTDIRGSLYASCGVVPRKKITVPKDFLDATLQNLEPVFAVGPILTTTSVDGLQVLMPPPQIQGYDAGFVSVQTFAEIKLPPVPPLGDLPVGRMSLAEGWVRLHKQKS